MKTFPSIINALFILVLLSVCHVMHGQSKSDNPYPVDRYISPLGIEWRLSGTFGEPRGNHFHAGADIKTNGATGYKLYAIADGYVSRIKVSPYGYGKALYINHRDGYTSVYAHMSSFAGKVDSLVKVRQYAEKSFEQDIYLDAGALTFNQGEVIGLSGNSGGSAGPHLHFEIRETNSQRPINPLFFGYQVEDTRKPQLMGVKLTSFGKGFYHTNDRHTEKYFSAGEVPDTIEMPGGTLAIGVHSLDRQDLANNRNGVFRVRMFVDSVCTISYSMDQLDFSEARYVNAFRDFYERKQNKTVYNCYRLPGNRLGVYEINNNDGFIKLSPGEVRNIVIDVLDFHDNISSVRFTVKGLEGYSGQKPGSKLDSAARIMDVVYDGNFNFITPDFRAYIPANTFYADIPLTYKKTGSSSKGIYSDIHQLHDQLVPMHKSAVVQLSGMGIPKQYTDKVVVVHKDLQGIEQSLGTFWKDGMISAKSREVGYFYVRIDSLVPEIKWLNFSEKTNSFRGTQIRVRISDNLSGISEYAGFIDDQWVVFDYDAKRDLLTYDFDEHCPPGEHLLRIVVKDKVNNKAVKELKFIAP